jgi:hypothetical protein
MDKLAVEYGLIKDVTYFSTSLGQGQDVVTERAQCFKYNWAELGISITNSKIMTCDR